MSSKHPFFDRLIMNRQLFIELLLSTCFINILALASPIFTIQVLTRYITNGVSATLITLLIGVLLAIFMECLFRWVRNRLASAICQYADQQLNHQVHSSLNNIPYARLNQIPLNKRQQVITNLQSIQQAYNHTNLNTILDLPFSCIFLIFIALLNIKLAIITAIVGMALWLVSLANRKGFGDTIQKIQQQKLHVSSLLSASLTNGATIRAFNASALIQSTLDKLHDKLHALNGWLDKRQGTLQIFNQNALTINTVLLFTVGSIEVVHGVINIGVLIGANVLAARTLMPITRLSTITEQLAKAKLAEQKITELESLNRKQTQGITLNRPSAKFNFRNTSFSYPNSTITLFEHLSLNIDTNQMICISGSNGSGKTTFALLLMGLLEPTHGDIQFDGINVQQLSSSWYRNQINYVPQKLEFVPGTILENILLSRKNISKSSISDSINLAGLSGFLNNLAEGIHTSIQENANLLAPGINKRIAIARAYLQKCPLAIIDEPFEFLDKPGRDMMLKHIQNMRRTQTIICCCNDPEILQLSEIVLNLDRKPIPQVFKKQVRSA